MLKTSRLGDILLSQRVVNSSQLEAALQHQATNGCRLGESLETLGICTEAEIARALAEQLELPFIDFTQTPPQPAAMRLLHRDVAVEYGVVPARLEGERLVVAAQNPLDIRLDEAIRRATRCSVIIASAPPSQIGMILGQYDEIKWRPAARLSSGAPAPTGAHRPPTAAAPRVGVGVVPAVGIRPPGVVPGVSNEAATAALTRRLEWMIADGFKRGAVEISFEPQPAGLIARGRIDGELQQLAQIPREEVTGALARLKQMAGYVPGGLPQPGPHLLRVDGHQYEMSARVFPVMGGELVVFRPLKEEVGLLALEELGFEAEMLASYRRALGRQDGLVMVCGPMNSGRTTTLYASLRHLAGGNRIVTVEELVEARLTGINQLQLSPSAGKVYPVLTGDAISLDPDILMIADMADRATADHACRLAAKGRLVLVASHAPHALRALARFLDLGIVPYTVASSLSGIMAQRLVRRVCEACAVRVEPPPHVKRAIRQTFGNLEENRFVVGRGCEACGKKGTRGRMVAAEWLEVDEDLRYLLSERIAPSLIQEHLAKRGFRSLEYDAMRKACQGLIPIDEVIGLRMELAAALDGAAGSSSSLANSGAAGAYAPGPGPGPYGVSGSSGSVSGPEAFGTAPQRPWTPSGAEPAMVQRPNSLPGNSPHRGAVPGLDSGVFPRPYGQKQ